MVFEGEAGPTVLEAVSEQEEVFVFTHMYANTYITGFVKIGGGQIPLSPDNKKYMSSLTQFLLMKRPYAFSPIMKLSIRI
ncbi:MULTISPECIES: hypothetical protein [Clostridia]|uniref:hypothetical protein n=1 Tax=Clostridia TaxID=186801 RepID=UPI000EA1E481|nr:MULTISPECIES: hypothetical protein [Clostridia]NBJ70594.1 hypothetical protein [Roseburia sp. 1XD42-34]RKI76594.1 hypothetical protein D7V87_12840 [Clostridium sp. 1xD42-85]